MSKTPTPPIYPFVSRRLRRIALVDIPDPLFASPLECNDQIPCSQCRNDYTPPWAEKLPFEHAPFAGKDGFNYFLTGLALACPSCGQLNDYWFPRAGNSPAVLQFYGDEASQWFGNRERLLYVYGFASFNPSRRAEVEHSVQDIKSRIRPGVDPDTWPLHAWEVRNTRWRDLNSVVLNTGEVNNLLRELMASMATRSEELCLSATVWPPMPLAAIGPDTENRVRDLTLSTAIFSVTDLVTRQGFGLNFTIEAQSDAHNSQGIDYFVERIGRGLFHSLPFLYSCRGRPVTIPITAPKSPVVEMEIADLLAFTVRRYFHCSECRKKSEFPLELFGIIHWSILTGKHFGASSSKGFPWKLVEEAPI